MVGCYQRTPRGTLGIFLVLSVLREVRPRIGSMSTYRICGDISCAASMRPAINRSIKIAIYGPGILAGTMGLKSVLFSRLRQLPSAKGAPTDPDPNDRTSPKFWMDPAGDTRIACPSNWTLRAT
jgi:hypothetical protein